MGSTTVRTLGRVLRAGPRQAHATTREAPSRPGVVAAVLPRSDAATQPAPADIRALTNASGVVAHSGPYAVVAALLEANGHTVLAQTEGRETTAAAVDQPKPTAGGWVRDGGVVIEAAFADALGVGPGDRVTLKPLGPEGRDGRPAVQGAGRSFRVAGVAVSAATPPYPEPACLANLCQGGADTGVVWLTAADASSLNPRRESPVYIVNLKLADPASAPAF